MSNHTYFCCNLDTFNNNLEATVKPVYKAQGPPNWGHPGYLAFSANMWDHWTGVTGGPNTTGCAWWAHQVTHWTTQINTQTLSAYQLQLKLAKIAFAQLMHTSCCCPGPVPSITYNPSAMKTINSFNLDTKYIKAGGETRSFTISGDKHSRFNLEISRLPLTGPAASNSDYYNFNTGLFQSTKTGLNDEFMGENSYNGDITFPVLADLTKGVKYEINLLVKDKFYTKHAEYIEVRFPDNSIDINSSTGSNSNVVQKEMYQAPDTRITIGGLSPNATVTKTGSDTHVTTASIDKPVVNIPFEFTWTVTPLRSLTINRQPTANDITAKVTRSIGAAVTIDGDTITSPVTCRRWSMADIDGLQPGMQVVTSAIDGSAGTGNGFTGSASIKEYLDQTTIFEGQENEYKVDNTRIPGVDTLGEKPTITRDATTKVATSVQTGNITFDQQASLHWAGDSVDIYAYGPQAIKQLTKYDFEFSDLAVVLTDITTTTTTAPSASATFDVTSAVGLAENISTVSGIGIDSEAINPTITRIKSLASGTYTTGATGYPAGELTLGVAQTLESGITLSFGGTALVATLTGNIKVNNIGPENLSLYLDLEKFLTMNAAPASV
tara:strand:+ start:3086 stop:4909 length:1824 start_codon:yes stop_codon:yes gene_type:complete